jgi:hypothetical protein
MYAEILPVRTNTQYKVCDFLKLKLVRSNEIGQRSFRAMTDGRTDDLSSSLTTRQLSVWYGRGVDLYVL